MPAAAPACHSLSHQQQHQHPTHDADAVVEALVREHLTKRQHTRTLAAFKQEQAALQQQQQPLITKRSVLQDILGLSSTAAAAAAPHGSSGSCSKPNSSSCSTLELLVQQLLLQRGGHNCSSSQQCLGAVTGSQRNNGSSSGNSVPEGCWGVTQPAGRLEQPQPPQQQQSQQRANVAPRPASARTGAATGSAAQLQQQVEDLLVVDDLEFDAGDAEQQQSAAAAHHSTAQHATGALLAGTTTTFSRPASAGFNNSAGGSRLLLRPLAAAAAQWQPLAAEQHRQLLQLVWGDVAAQPEAAWQQGLLWSNVPGLEWGLLQLAGGPCGALAAVQAHLLATLMQQQLWRPALPTSSNSSGSWAADGSSRSMSAASAAAVLLPEQLQEALVESLALMLWACATCGSSTGGSVRPASVVMLPQQSLGGSSAGSRGLCDAGAVLREAQVAAAHSLQETQALVRAALPQWSQRKGWGVLLLVYSALLSRSCAGARADMDTADTRLVDSLGYCSMELVNLLLTGSAVSNVFDGRQVFGSRAAGGGAGAGSAGGDDEELVIKGVLERSRVGLLTLFEWYRYVEVGQHLKSPQLPVWVVCSESHFSVLALCCAEQQQRAGVDTALLQPSARAPLLLQHYDGLCKQQGPVVLEVQQQEGAAAGGWTPKMAGVCEERGVWQGRPIPPLECVVETKWPDVSVSWHGSEPIL